jgi:hypothetical protein
MLRVIVLFLLTLMLSGCGAPLRKGDITLGEDDAFYIFGLKPSNTKVQVFSGYLDNEGRFHQDALANATFNGKADQGYAVGSAKAGSVLAVTRVFVDGVNSVFRPFFVPCADAKTVSFTAAKGKMIYLGDFEYQFNGDKLDVKYGTDIDAARRHLEANFPNLAPHLEQGKVNFVPTSLPCTFTIYVPIYLPR